MPLRQRLLKYARRLLIVLLVLAVLGFAAFWWLCYSPFEGEVDNMMALVPYDVEFAARVDYDALLASGWPNANLEENPLHPAISDWIQGTGSFRTPENRPASLPGVRDRIQQIEDQINANIPLSASWATFGVEKDVLAGETIVAGRWCAGFDPRHGPPSWQEILLLTRVSWRTKCIAALKHGFVRDQVNKDRAAPKIEALDDDVYRLTFREIPVSPPSARSGCGRGFVMPPENVWYLRRVKDVIAVSNSENLITGVAELSKDDPEQSFADRPGFNPALRPDGFVGAADLTPLHAYLVKAMEQNPRAGILGRYLRPRSIEKFNGAIVLESTDLVRANAQISYIASEAREVADNVYRLAPRPVSEGIAGLVPAEDTFAMLFVRSQPKFLLSGIYEDALTLKERALWNQQLSKMRKYQSMDEFFDELAEYMDNTSTVAISRLPEVHDKYKYDEFYSDEPDPMQGVAVMIRVRHGRTYEEINEFLKDRVPFLGFKSDLEQVEYRGYTYTRLKLQQRTMDIHNLEPSYIVVQDQIIFANHYNLMQRIIDMIADKGRGSMRDDPTFRTTMAALPPEGHVGLFLDIEKLTRVPPDADPASKPKGFLWDMRTSVIRDDPAHDTTVLGTKIREQERRKYRRPLSVEDDEKVEAEVARQIQAHLAAYPQYAEEYRRTLEGLRRLGGFGFVFSAAGPEIDAQIALTLRDTEDGLSWKRN